MAKELTHSFYISINGAEPVPMEQLSAEEKTRCYDAMAQRLSRRMSDYYTQHPEEYDNV